MRRKFITGFGGSAGTAVVTSHDAMLWTDSRYWNEANMQLDSSLWSLMKQGEPKVPTIIEYPGEIAKKKQDETTDGEETEKKILKVGIDPFVFASSFADEFEEGMKKVAKEMTDDDNLEIGELVPSYENLIDPIWGLERPPIPHNRFRVHPLEYAGISVVEKVKKIREEMESKKATMAVFCTLDDVAYLFNIRCMGDVDTCPVGIAYATITKENVCLYCDMRKVESNDVQEHLSGVIIKPYEDIVEDLQQHVNDKDSNNKVWIDKSRSNLALVSVIPKKSLIDSQNAVTPMKACKNKQELEGIRKAHEVDGAAMANFISWLEETVVVQSKSVSEVEIDEVLTAYRAKQPGFLECSFPTIAGVGSNAAIIHYSAKPGDLMKYLDTSEPILIDSGGQYTYGTTDVTRTWHFGKATDEFKEVYTRVLKGNIGVDSMVFPEKTPGFVLDVLARQSLWEVQKGMLAFTIFLFMVYWNSSFSLSSIVRVLTYF
jgi:Xaa-Pro aminopeptidase